MTRLDIWVTSQLTGMDGAAPGCADVTRTKLSMYAYITRQSDSQMILETVKNDAASKTQYVWIRDSTCWSRSNDLWVMSPTRFLCAKVLAQLRHYLLTHKHRIHHTSHPDIK